MLPEHDHGQGVQLAVLEQGLLDGPSFLLAHLRELHAGVGDHGRGSVGQMRLAEQVLELLVRDIPEDRRQEPVGIDGPAVFIEADPGPILEVQALDRKASPVDPAAVPFLQQRGAAQHRRQDFFQGVRSPGVGMVVVALDQVQEIDHAAPPGLPCAFVAVCRAGHRGDPLHELFPVRQLPGILFPKLGVDDVEKGVFVVPVAEHRAFVAFQFLLEGPQEGETGKAPPLAVKVLANVGRRAVRGDPVMRELEGDPLVRGHAPVEGNGHGRGLEVDEVKRVDPPPDLGPEPFCVEVGVRVMVAGLLDLQALPFEHGQAPRRPAPGVIPSACTGSALAWSAPPGCTPASAPSAGRAGDRRTQELRVQIAEQENPLPQKAVLPGALPQIDHQGFGEVLVPQPRLLTPALLESARQPGALLLQGARELASAALGAEGGPDLPILLVALGQVLDPPCKRQVSFPAVSAGVDHVRDLVDGQLDQEGLAQGFTGGPLPNPDPRAPVGLVDQEQLVEPIHAGPGVPVGHEQMGADLGLREGQAQHMSLKGHVVQIGYPLPLDRAACGEHVRPSGAVEGFGLDLNEVQPRTVLDQDVDPDKQVPVANGRLVEGHRFPLEQPEGQGQCLLVLQGLDLVSAGEVQLGHLPDLESPLGQGGQEGVLFPAVGVPVLARVEEFGLALQGQHEAGFGQVAGCCVHRTTASSLAPTRLPRLVAGSPLCAFAGELHQERWHGLGLLAAAGGDVRPGGARLLGILVCRSHRGVAESDEPCTWCRPVMSKR